MNASLLLVVDMQNGFLKDNHTRAIIAGVNELASLWEARGLPVVYSRFVNVEDSNFERLRDWHELKHEPDTDLVDDLDVVSSYVFKKGTYSAWREETAGICIANQLKDIVIVGVDTNECVLATALAVFEAGFTPWVVRDLCVSNGGEEAHRNALELMQVLLGKQQVITAEELSHE